MAPLVCHLYDLGLIEAQAVPQSGVFAAALSFARAEGLMPAPEPSHALKVAMDEALRCKASGERKVIVFNLCGHGHFDMAAYEQYLGGRLHDHEHPEHAIEAALKDLPGLQPDPK